MIQEEYEAQIKHHISEIALLIGKAGNERIRIPPLFVKVIVDAAYPGTQVLTVEVRDQIR